MKASFIVLALALGAVMSSAYAGDIKSSRQEPLNVIVQPMGDGERDAVVKVNREHPAPLTATQEVLKLANPAKNQGS